MQPGDVASNDRRRFIVMPDIFGAVSGEPIERYTLQHSESSLRVQVITLGATITSVLAPDASGNLGEVSLGFDDAAPYSDGTSPYFGCVAGRVANRIAKGSFSIDGKTYSLATNNGPNHLHGGKVGYDKRNWSVTAATATSITLELESKDGDEGYPGNLHAIVTYSLPTPTSLRMEYAATSDATTPCNLTNHTYWNLKVRFACWKAPPFPASPRPRIPNPAYIVPRDESQDGGASTIFEHEIELAADFYTPVDDTSIPTGEIRAVSGAMDLRGKATIADHGLAQADQGMGYDHNWCLRPTVGTDGLRLVATVHEPTSGRVMVVRTTEPGALVDQLLHSHSAPT